jgi:MFS family permease
MIVTRAFAGLGLAIASPAGFGIVDTAIRHEPARTIVFAMFGIGGPIGGALGGLLGGGMTAIGE